MNMKQKPCTNMELNFGASYLSLQASLVLYEIPEKWGLRLFPRGGIFKIYTFYALKYSDLSFHNENGGIYLLPFSYAASYLRDLLHPK